VVELLCLPLPLTILTTPPSSPCRVIVTNEISCIHRCKVTELLQECVEQLTGVFSYSVFLWSLERRHSCSDDALVCNTCFEFLLGYLVLWLRFLLVCHSLLREFRISNLPRKPTDIPASYVRRKHASKFSNVGLQRTVIEWVILSLCSFTVWTFFICRV
jgi:hypothetical protein